MKLTGLKGRIPVQPLDDERLTNIERRIVSGAAETAAHAPASRMRAPRFGFAMAVAVTVTVAVGAGVAGWQLRGDGSKTIVAAEPVRMNTTGERSVLDIGDARIESDLATDFTVTRPDGGVLVTMKRGKVELQVDKRGNRAPLVVAAGDTRVVVVGTRFSVDYGDGTNGVDVRVIEGVVRVERHQQDVRVAAGQAWTTSRGVIALAELPERATQVAIAKQPGTAVTTATGNRATGDTSATVGDATDRDTDKIEIDTNTPDVLRDRTSTVPNAKIATTGANHGSTAAKKTGGPEVTRQQTFGKGSSGSAAGSAELDLRALVLKQTVLPPLDLGPPPEGVKPGEWTNMSISKYRQDVINKKGAEAALALYSIAVQQHLKLGRNADALQTLELYVRRFAGTEYKTTYHAALWLRVRILCTKGVDDRCRQAAYTYMHQASGTPAAAVAQRLTLSPR